VTSFWCVSAFSFVFLTFSLFLGLWGAFQKLST